MTQNLLILTDSYKPSQWAHRMPGTTNFYSYFSSRDGAKYPFSVVSGYTYLFKRYLEDQAFTQEDIGEAHEFWAEHFGNPNIFNRDLWRRLYDVHGGVLPLEIKAVLEGTPVPTGNVMLTATATDPEFGWVVQYVIESLISQIWYPTLVATYSAMIRQDIEYWVNKTGGDPAGVDFMHHDFGFRGSTSVESAMIGGAAHLTQFKGTDTAVAIRMLKQYYADNHLALWGASIPAAEHSGMTQLGPGRDLEVWDHIVANTPGDAIFATPIDSYDCYAFMDGIVERKDVIMARAGKYVARPDSNTPRHPIPADQMVHHSETIWAAFGGTETSTGHRLFDPHIGLIWGDGIDRDGIWDILEVCADAGFCASNYAFGEGGHLLQADKNRDVQRNAFKCSAQLQSGVWQNIVKDPLDPSKKSLTGRFKLLEKDGKWSTVAIDAPGADQLVTVFHNGTVRSQPFGQVIERAKAARTM